MPTITQRFRAGVRGGVSLVLFLESGIAKGDDEPEDTAGILDVVLDHMNERFAIVSMGKLQGTIVDLSDPRDPVEVKETSLHTLFADCKFPLEDAKKPVALSRVWLPWPGRRKVPGIMFEPTGSHKHVPSDVHNLWQGFPLAAMAGNAHEPLLAHLHDYVAATEAEYQFLLAWFADMIQRPGGRCNVHVVLRGEQGAGKTIFADYMAAIQGSYFLRIADHNQLTGHFNAHLANRILINAEEAFWAGDKRAEGVLKNLCTSPTLTVEGKFQHPISYSNHARILITSNENWVIPAAIGERRWAVFDVRGDHAKDREYWTPIQEAKHGDGPANLLHFLLHYEYDPAILHLPLMTRGKAQQTVRSLNTVEGFWYNVLTEGVRVMPHGDGDDDVFGRSGGIGKEAVYEAYERWCMRGRSRKDPECADMFWRELRPLLPDDAKEFRPRKEGHRARMWWLPSRENCQKAFAKKVDCGWADLAGDTDQVEENPIEPWESLE